MSVGVLRFVAGYGLTYVGVLLALWGLHYLRDGLLVPALGSVVTVPLWLTGAYQVAWGGRSQEEASMTRDVRTFEADPWVTEGLAEIDAAWRPLDRVLEAYTGQRWEVEGRHAGVAQLLVLAGVPPEDHGIGPFSTRQELEEAAQAVLPFCQVCGCTEDDACPGGCAWVTADLCNACAYGALS